MNHFKYLEVIFIFFAPLYIGAFIFFSDLIKKNLRLIGDMTIFGIVMYFINDIIATQIEAWGYGGNTLPFKIFGTAAVETLLWMILLSIFVTMAVLVSTGREKEGMAILIPSFITKNLPDKLRDFVNKNL